MIRPCPKHIDCPPVLPFTNYSSEFEDLQDFFSISWGADGCIGHCVSLVSQSEADLCALRQAVQCEGGNPPDRPPTTLYPNDPTECTIGCPNGTSFTFIVPSGSFIAPSLDEANAQANSYCNAQAPIKQFCLGNLPKCWCEGVLFGARLPISGVSQPLTITLTSNLPTGLSWAQDGMSINITGTPFATGNFLFTFRATDADGNHADGAYEISIIGIISPGSPLPDFTIGVPYSVQLVANGGSGSYAFNIAAGALPDGLTLSSSGLISGTPTSGSFGPVTFEVTDLHCATALESSFPPRAKLVTHSVTKIATVIGYKEFTNPSVPPKKYKNLSWSGTSEQQGFTWTDATPCAHAKYVYSGTSSISDTGAQLSRYRKDLYQWCPGNRRWPNNFTSPDLGAPTLKGYCWQPDPNSCGNCVDPMVLDKDVSIDSVSDVSDLALGSTPTFLDKTNFKCLGVSTTGSLIFSPLVNFPMARVNDITATWVRVTAQHNYTGLLEDEYTDAIALANAVVINSSSDTAENTPRTTGFISRFTSVTFDIVCSNLVPLQLYTASVRFYNTATGASTVRSYNFVAAGTTETIHDSVPTPPVGQPIQVKAAGLIFT